MEALICDICGGKLVMQSGGVAKCDSCGMEYTKERIQEKVQEIKGTVKIDGSVEIVKGDAEKERLIKTAQECFRKGAIDEADKMFRNISKNYPNEWRAWMGMVYCESMLLTDDEISKYFCAEKIGFSQEARTPEDFLKETYKKALLFAPKEEQIKINKYRNEFCKNLYERMIAIYKNQLNQVVQKITTAQSDVDKCQKKYEKKKNTLVLSVLLNILSVILFLVFIKQVFIPLVCIGVCIITIVIFYDYKNNYTLSHNKHVLWDANRSLEKLEKEKSSFETKIEELKRKLYKLN